MVVTKRTVKKPSASSRKTKQVKSAAPKKSSLTVPVLTSSGKSAGSTKLPAIFNTQANAALLAQAIRVYRANKRQGTASVKTRGEVKYSTRKIYRQKGTGGARHGSRKAPIFVGGGITFGPSLRDFSLKLPQKMRKKALHMSLTEKLQDNAIIFIDSVQKVGPKTKNVEDMLKKLDAASQKSTLCAVSGDRRDFIRAARNIPRLTVVSAAELTTYDILANQCIIFEKDALSVFDTKTKK